MCTVGIFTINIIKRADIIIKKYLIFHKNLSGIYLVACPKFDHYIYFSPFSRNNVRQTTLQPKTHTVALENGLFQILLFKC
jgi:hypothetical protein